MMRHYEVDKGNLPGALTLLVKEIASHSVFGHSWLLNLKAMSDASFLNNFREFICVSKVYGQHFSSYVRNAIQSAATTELREALIANLAEEEGDEGQPSHIELFEKMTIELGVDGSESAFGRNPLLSIVQRLLREKLEGAEKFVALGALVLGSEYAVPRLYGPILDRLHSFDASPLPASIHFFNLHVECDADHANRAIQALEQEIKNEDDFIQLRFGALSALNLRQALLDSIDIRRA